MQRSNSIPQSIFVLLIILFSLGTIVTSKAQLPTARVAVNSFWIEEESDFDSSNGQVLEINIDHTLNLSHTITYDLSWQLGTAIKLVFSEGSSQNHNLQMKVEIPTPTGPGSLEMNFLNGVVTDETGAVLVSEVRDFDVFYFALLFDHIEYFHNQEKLKAVEVEEVNLVATYSQFSEEDLNIIFELEPLPNYIQPMTADLNGQVLFPAGITCGPNLNMSVVPNVEITLSAPDGRFTPMVTTTNIDGQFSFNNVSSGLISMSANYVGTAHTSSTGVSSIDAIQVQNHLNGSSVLYCPLQRLAADVNQDGQLDGNDVSIINLHAAGIDQPEIGTRWSFVPIPYVFPSDSHPDIHFTNQFWDHRKDNANDQLLPFSSILRLFGKIYTYLPIANNDDTSLAQSLTWQPKLNSWMFDANPACAEVSWGFYMFRPGDVNGSSQVELNWPAPLTPYP